MKKYLLVSEEKLNELEVARNKMDEVFAFENMMMVVKNGVEIIGEKEAIERFLGPIELELMSSGRGWKKTVRAKS